MNVATIGLPENSAWSAGYASEYAKGVALYRRALWRMTFLEGSLAAGATTTFPVFRFPRPVHVTRMHVLTTRATNIDNAALQFGISDVSDRPREQVGSGQFVTDGRFNQTVPCLAMTGSQFGWFLLDRWQPHNSQWIWTLTNTSADPIFPIFMLDVEPAIEGEVMTVAP